MDFFVSSCRRNLLASAFNSFLCAVQHVYKCWAYLESTDCAGVVQVRRVRHVFASSIVRTHTDWMWSFKHRGNVIELALRPRSLSLNYIYRFSGGGGALNYCAGTFGRKGGKMFLHPSKSFLRFCASGRKKIAIVFFFHCGRRRRCDTDWAIRVTHERMITSSSILDSTATFSIVVPFSPPPPPFLFSFLSWHRPAIKTSFTLHWIDGTLSARIVQAPRWINVSAMISDLGHRGNGHASGSFD